MNDKDIINALLNGNHLNKREVHRAEVIMYGMQKQIEGKKEYL